MDVKKAIRIAIESIAEIFEDQNIDNIMLEEIDRDSADNYLVTVGFDRVNNNRPALAALAAISLPRQRVYKVVKLDQYGAIVNIKDRKLEDK